MDPANPRTLYPGVPAGTVDSGETINVALRLIIDVTQGVSDILQAIVDNNPGTALADKLEDVIASLQVVLEELIKSGNEAAVGNIEGAVGSLDVGELEDAVEDGLIDATLGAQLMDILAWIAQQMAIEALDQAIAQGGNPSDIADAEEALEDGNGLRGEGAYKDAVNKYKDALAKAQGAL